MRMLDQKHIGKETTGTLTTLLPFQLRVSQSFNPIKTRPLEEVQEVPQQVVLLMKGKLHELPNHLLQSQQIRE